MPICQDNLFSLHIIHTIMVYQYHDISQLSGVMYIVFQNPTLPFDFCLNQNMVSFQLIFMLHIYMYNDAVLITCGAVKI